MPRERKPVKPKPTTAWAVHDGYGNILPNTVRVDRGSAALMHAMNFKSARVIRVTIAPARPKR